MCILVCPDPSHTFMRRAVRLYITARAIYIQNLYLHLNKCGHNF